MVPPSYIYISSIIITVVCLVGIVCNTVILVVGHRVMHVSHRALHFLVVSAALSDLLISVFTMPYNVCIRMGWIQVSSSLWPVKFNVFINRKALAKQEDNALGSIRPSIRLCVCGSA